MGDRVPTVIIEEYDLPGEKEEKEIERYIEIEFL
ncbi:hypothetical protein OCC_13620 [Thermococcus litoralis DSM 5473]|uniref:Uncharacterized protein n=1 Tax=Thermococcus litoralis (strain ATCC 51850 / DSM 5473 / JCM 8560 / NS-C) TaxID=523849 RepID=S5ZI76_THELN|nr:hypothetical protein OCC_13620 [Thermococcus litoralis DSM 5473]